MASKPLPFDPIGEARRHWVAHWGQEPAPSMAAVTSIMRCQQILLLRLNDLLRPMGLTFPRYEALMLLRLSRTGALPLGKIGERLQVHRTSVTGLVDRLEERGLVVRTAHATDRRTTLAEITPAGRELAEQATRVLNEERFAVPELADAWLEELTLLLRDFREAAGDFQDEDPPIP
ncbi:MAG TPA: MarR family transcriptional regulator [Solirubrobacteraceae bacterium]|jgi:DNA-binding MarR family transcriptional regulator|nr:MarR family transcriptional regulator [Solirubrobacteraceae bacterium]